MRQTSTALLLLTAGVLMASTAGAQTRVLPYAGYALGAGYDNGAAFVAEQTDELQTQGGVLVGLGAAFPILERRFPYALTLQPSIEATFLPGETVSFEGGESLALSQFVLRAGGELVAEIPVGRAPVAPSLGLGLSFARYTADFDASAGAEVAGDAHVTAWALGPSLVAGLQFGRGSLSPFVQARYRFTNPSPTFSGDRTGEHLDNGFSAAAGVSIAL